MDKNVKKYLSKIGQKGGSKKSAAKTAAAVKANKARWADHKPRKAVACASC